MKKIITEINIPDRMLEIKPDREPDLPSIPSEDPGKIPEEMPDNNPPIEIPPSSNFYTVI